MTEDQEKRLKFLESKHNESSKIFVIMTARIMALESIVDQIDPFLAHQGKQFVLDNTKMLLSGVLSDQPVDPS